MIMSEYPDSYENILIPRKMQHRDYIIVAVASGYIEKSRSDIKCVITEKLKSST